MSKLDDLLSKKKTVLPVLDLSKTVVHSKEELNRLIEKVPDFKMRPIKVREDDIKIKEKGFSFKLKKKKMRKLLKNNGEIVPLYVYADPIPTEMKLVALSQLYMVPIDWKMLTSLRPKSKQDEEFFNRIVEMGKLVQKTRTRDKKDYALNRSFKKTKNKSGIIETKLLTCIECGEEMCDGKTCSLFTYDLFARAEPKAAKSKATIIGIVNKTH